MEAIGPYQVVRRLGQGGMGTVFAVRHPDVPRELALKTIEHPDGEDLQRFVREARLLAKLRHPGVVTIHDLNRDPLSGRTYLVSELVEGRDLGEVLKTGVEWREAARIVAELADAVAAVHAAGIVHRDLKPANAILRPDGRVVLLDFGLARELDARSLTQTGVVIGTPAYMSPEQARGKGAGEVGPASDVYSLGAILYALLARRAPFSGPLFVVLEAACNQAPDPEPLRESGCPEALEGLALRALAKDPARRPESAAAFARALRASEAAPRPRALAPWLTLPALLLVLVAVGAYVFPPRASAPATPSPPPSSPAQARASSTPARAVDLERAYREVPLESAAQLRFYTTSRDDLLAGLEAGERGAVEVAKSLARRPLARLQPAQRPRLFNTSGLSKQTQAHLYPFAERGFLVHYDGQRGVGLRRYVPGAASVEGPRRPGPHNPRSISVHETRFAWSTWKTGPFMARWGKGEDEPTSTPLPPPPGKPADRLGLELSPSGERLALATKAGYFLYTPGETAPIALPLLDTVEPPEELGALLFLSERRLVATHLSEDKRHFVLEWELAPSERTCAQRTTTFGRRLLRVSDERYLIGSDSMSQLKLVPFGGGEPRPLNGGYAGGWISGLARAPGGGVVSLNARGALQLWQLEPTLALTRQLQLEPPKRRLLPREPRSLACSNDGAFLAIGFFDGSVEVYANLPRAWPRAE